MPIPTGSTINTYTVSTQASVYSYWIDELSSTQTGTNVTNWIEQDASRRGAITTATVWYAWSDEWTVMDGERQMALQRAAAEKQLRWELQQRELDKRKPHDAHVMAWERHTKRLADRRAGRRALATLLRCLDSHQRELFRECGYFAVIGGKTGQVYRVRQGTIGNIDVMDMKKTGKVKHRLCAHPKSPVPVYDVMLAQALHLSANEEEFLKRANKHPAPLDEAALAA
jgi:hypothetical protein